MQCRKCYHMIKRVTKDVHQGLEYQRDGEPKLRVLVVDAVNVHAERYLCIFIIFCCF